MHSFREISFQVVSIITTTVMLLLITPYGDPFLHSFFSISFSGASAGSTSGGIKIVRIILLIKNGLRNLKGDYIQRQ